MINYHRWWSQDQQVCATLLHFEHEPRLHWGKVGCFHFHWNGRGILIEDQTDINSSMGKWSQKMPFRKAILKTTVDFFEEKKSKNGDPPFPDTSAYVVNFATKMHVCVKCAGTGEICWLFLRLPSFTGGLFSTLYSRPLSSLSSTACRSSSNFNLHPLMTIINHEIPMINKSWSITKQ